MFDMSRMLWVLQCSNKPAKHKLFWFEGAWEPGWKVKDKLHSGKFGLTPAASENVLTMRAMHVKDFGQEVLRELTRYLFVRIQTSNRLAAVLQQLTLGVEVVSLSAPRFSPPLDSIE